MVASLWLLENDSAKWVDLLKRGTTLVERETVKNWDDRQRETATKVKVNFTQNFVKDVKPRISVIVPIYNTSMYLEECLNSILNQQFENFEVICVNDGSNDESRQILVDFANRDNRVKVIDKENAGYGHTINLGIDNALGEYILIVESDDYILQGMMSTLYEAAEAHELDFVKSDFYRFTTEQSATRLFYHALTSNEALYNRVVSVKEDPLLFRFTNTWTGLYRRDFLVSQNIRHNETPGASYQDNGFWFLTTVCAERYMYLETPFYMNRRDNPNSSVFNDNKLYAGNDEFAYIEGFLDSRPDLRKEFYSALVLKKFDTYRYNYIRVSDDLRDEYVDACSREFSDAIGQRFDRSVFNDRDWNLLVAWATAPEEFRNKMGRPVLPKFTGALGPRTIPIVFIADDQYAMPAGVAIQSLIENKSKDTQVQINIVAVDMSDSNIKKLTSFKRTNVDVQILATSGETIADLHQADLTQFGVNSTALMKFFLPELLPGLDKVLYLDDDVIVNKDLSKLFSTDISMAYAGMSRDVPQVLYENQPFGKEFGINYFNSGVLLLNLAKLREDGISKKLVEVKKSITSRFMDQDVFNIVFENRIVNLGLGANTMITNLVRSKRRYSMDKLNNVSGTKYRSLSEVYRGATVVHFGSKDKPWKYFDVPGADEWLGYFSRSPFGHLRLVRRSLSAANQDSLGELQGNGVYEVDDSEKDSSTVVLALTVSRNTYAAVGSIYRQIEDAFKRSGTGKARLYVLHDDLDEQMLDGIRALSSADILVSSVDISGLLAHMKIAFGKKSMPSNFERYLIPEVLFHEPTVLSVSDFGVELRDDPSSLFANFSETTDVLVTPVRQFSSRYLVSAAWLLRPSSLVKNNTKKRFMNNYLGAPGKSQGPVVASRRAFDPLKVGVLSDRSLDTRFYDLTCELNDLENARSQELEIRKLQKEVDRLLAALRNVPKSSSPVRSEDKDSYERGLQEGKRLVQESDTFKVGRAIVYVPSRVLKAGSGFLSRARKSLQ